MTQFETKILKALEMARDCIDPLNSPPMTFSIIDDAISEVTSDRIKSTVSAASELMECISDFEGLITASQVSAWQKVTDALRCP